MHVVCLGLLGCSEGKRDAAHEEARPLPQIVPYLDAQPSAVDGQGSATLEPDRAVPIGARQDFSISFTVGEAGVAPGGFILLQISPWWGWSEPQTRYAEAPGYAEVTVSSHESAFQIEALPMHRVVVWSHERLLRAGDVVTFQLRNVQVDRFAEAEELFQLFVDADGDGHAAPIVQQPSVRILPRAAARLIVNAPSQMTPGTDMRIRVAAVDGVGNWAALPAGPYTLRTTRDDEEQEAQSEELEQDREALAFTCALQQEGIHFFDVKGPSGLQGRSNVLLCTEGAPKLNLYFGDIHGHSRMSDGTGTPEDYYRYARDVSGLDMAALTDHVDHGTIRIEGAPWERIKKATNDAHEPHRFVTFLGYEWTNWTYGHRNVYFRDGDGPVFRSIDEGSHTPQELWGLLKPYEAMTIAHHVGGGPVPTDWSIAPGAKEWLVEICSIHGNSEYYGAEMGIYHPVQGAFVRDALAKGYKLGIIGSGDTHDGHPGQRSISAPVTGIMGVYCEELTRESVWEAFRRRQVYGTSGPRIILNFQVGHAPMGSEVTWSASQGAVPIALRAVCCDTIKAIEVIRNGGVLLREPGESVIAYLLLEDPQPPAGTSWYYVRVLQEDGQMAWSSPVWIENRG